MMSFFRKLQNKYVVAAFGAVIAVSTFGATSVPVSATSCPNTSPTPVFNFWPLTYSTGETCNDLPLIEARNLSAASVSRDNRYSASQSEHDAGINANVGDQVRVSIYFDNGSSQDADVFDQNTMHNFQVGSTYNTGSSTVHTVSGVLTADNVPTVTSTSAHQGGNITINTPVATQLQYVSGSTQMCLGHDAAVAYGANMNQTCGTDDQGQAKILINLPDGIANGKVSIGDLPPCFPYSGTVVFTVNVLQGQIVTPPPSNGSLYITKQVENLSYNNNHSYTSSVTAYHNDTVEYKITVGNNSNVTLNNVTMNDPAISGIQLNSGSNNVNIGTLAPSQSESFYLDGQVTGSYGTFNNTAYASASNAQTVQASASVYVAQVVQPIYPVQPVYPVYPVQPVLNANVTLSKSAFNNTKNVDATSVPADKEDFITYTLNATNNGNGAASNFVVSDDLSNVLNYASMVNLNGGFMNGTTISWPAVNIAANSSVQETFEVRVNYTLPASYNNLQLVNTYGNTVTIQINNPTVIVPVITAPKTGPAAEAAYAIGFATLLTAGFYLVRSKLSRKTV